MTPPLTPTSEPHDAGTKMIERHMKERQTMTPQPDFKGALEAFDAANYTNELRSNDEQRSHLKTIRTALLIADALMQEPTEEMKAIFKGNFVQFLEMREQVLKEIL